MQVTFSCIRWICLPSGTFKKELTNQSFLNVTGFIKFFLEDKAIQSNGKNSFEMMIIIISLKTNNLIATFNGPYLLAAQTNSFQFILSYWMENLENGLRTILNKRDSHIGKKGCQIEQDDSTLVTSYRKMLLCSWKLKISL